MGRARALYWHRVTPAGLCYVRPRLVVPGGVFSALYSFFSALLCFVSVVLHFSALLGFGVVVCFSAADTLEVCVR